jgi:hypothetical protein
MYKITIPALFLNTSDDQIAGIDWDLQKIKSKPNLSLMVFNRGIW